MKKRKEKIQKLSIGALNFVLIFVPIFLMALSISLATGWVWDILLFAGIVGTVVPAFRQYEKWHDQRAGQFFQRIPASVGVLISVMLLSAQAEFCESSDLLLRIRNSAVIWMFVFLAITGMYQLIQLRKHYS